MLVRLRRYDVGRIHIAGGKRRAVRGCILLSRKGPQALICVECPAHSYSGRTRVLSIKFLCYETHTVAGRAWQCAVRMSPVLQHRISQSCSSNENMSKEIDINPHHLKDVDLERALRLPNLIPFPDCHAGRDYR